MKETAEPTLEIVPAPKPEKFQLSKRDVREIIAERIEIGPNADSLKINGDMPIEEFVPVLDYFTALSQKSQFLIGDLLVYGNGVYKEKLVLIMGQLGRSISDATLSAYATVSKAFAPKDRQAKLPWSHYQATAALVNDKEAGGKAKAIELLKAAATGGSEGKPTTQRELKREVEAVKTPKPAKPGKKAPGRKTGATKPAKAAAKKAPTKKAREQKAEETAALNDLYKRVLPAICSALAETLKVLDAAPVKGDLSLIDVIKESTNGDKKAFVKDAPEIADLLRLHKMIQGVADKTGY